jgi:hypothetical protein
LLPGACGLTAPHTRSNRAPLSSWFPSCFRCRGCVELWLLVVFVPRTSSTPVATWFWQTEGRSAQRVILGVRPSEFILLEFQSPSRRVFIGSHSLPPLWSPNRSFKLFCDHYFYQLAFWRHCIFSSDVRKCHQAFWRRCRGANRHKISFKHSGRIIKVR